MSRQVIQTEQAPKAIGPYSQAVAVPGGPLGLSLRADSARPGDRGAGARVTSRPRPSG